MPSSLLSTYRGSKLQKLRMGTCNMSVFLATSSEAFFTKSKQLNSRKFPHRCRFEESGLVNFNEANLYKEQTLGSVVRRHQFLKSPCRTAPPPPATSPPLRGQDQRFVKPYINSTQPQESATAPCAEACRFP